MCKVMWKSLCCVMLGGTSHMRCSPSSWWIVVLYTRQSIRWSLWILLESLMMHKRQHLRLFACISLHVLMLPSIFVPCYFLFYFSNAFSLSTVGWEHTQLLFIFDVFHFYCCNLQTLHFFIINCDVPCLFMLTIQSSFLCLCIVMVFKDNLQRCS